MNLTPNDLMTRALQLAALGRFTASPNPMVGCVIVKNGEIVGEGFHREAGSPHAEINALNAAGIHAKHADMYVTLEPCCHHNRTPPCVDELIKAEIRNIYIACLDPNPKVCGQSISKLRNAGIRVEVGLCMQAAQELNRIYFHYIKHKRPFVIAKWAMSLDGKTITHKNDTRDISNKNSRADTHVTRRAVDAILVGANTAIIDNPSLTARIGVDQHGKQPIRIILSSKNRIPNNLSMFKTEGKTIIATTYSTQSHFDFENVEVLHLRANQGSEVDLYHLLDELGQREITSLLVEGGMITHESFFKENLINEYQIYVAPIIIGSLEKKRILQTVDIKSIAQDVRFTAINKGDEYV